MSFSSYHLKASPVERLKSVTTRASEVVVQPDAPLLRYLRSAETMFSMANEHFDANDYENALFYYVRYAT